MRLTQDGIKLLHEFEGLKLNAYLCPAKIWTIGYGNTFYEDGSKVRPGDVITLERAESLFFKVVNDFAKGVRESILQPIEDYKFSALVCLAYNIGINAFRKSTLLKLVNENPNNPEIEDQFLRWNRAGGKVMNGLTRRRIAEAKLYFNQ